MAACATPVRVLIVDDSATQRRLLARHIGSDRRFQVIGAAAHAQDARRMIRAGNPQVLTLDIDMPEMDGITFLRQLMRLRPMPVVMLSARTAAGSDAALDALRAGAVDCLEKGADIYRPGPASLCDRLFEAAFAQASLPGVAVSARPSFRSDMRGRVSGQRLCLIGASTGGVVALEEILSGLPENCPPIAIAQHMPGRYLARFAARLDRQVRPAVRLAGADETLTNGQVVLAPGDGMNLLIEPDGPAFRTRLTPHIASQGNHCPSVGQLFRSAVPFADRVLAVLLTGMGRDGVEAMGHLRRAGAVTLAQDKDRCTVFGMPAAALSSGAASRAVPLEKVAAEILLAGLAGQGRVPFF